MSEFARGGVIHVGQPDGTWREIPGVASVEFKRTPDPKADETRTTLQRFTGSLAFDLTPPMREAFRQFIETSIEIIEWMEARPRRSAMRTDYRAKTRRRNRRRK